MNRQGDTDNRTYFQTDRFFNANDQWFFATREAR